jgi:hypothetical protein
LKIQTRPITITLGNGANHDIVGADQSFARITGPTGAFSIDGIAKGKDGQLLMLYNTTAQAMTITDKATSASLAGNKINLLGNTAVTTGPGVVKLIYDGANAEWVFLSLSA